MDFDLSALARRLFSTGISKPVAYSRLTRTPIRTSEDLPDDLGGVYDNGEITLRPEELQRSSFIIPHESAHAIYDQGRLKDMAASLASHVGEGPRNRVLGSSVYRQMGPYSGSPEQVSDEGLAFSVGDRDETPYVNYSASQLKNPKLAETLKRLHRNSIQVRRLGGLGALQ